MLFMYVNSDLYYFLAYVSLLALSRHAPYAIEQPTFHYEEASI